MVAILLVAFFVFRETVETIRSWWWSPVALIALWTFLSPLGLPGTPLLLAGAVVFGPWWGFLYNLTGATLGAMASFLFARVLGHDLVAHVLGEARIERIERRMEHYAFWSLLTLRLFPIPWPVFNFGAALAGIRFGQFVLSTAIGMIPQMFVWNFFYASLGSATVRQDRQTLTWIVLAFVLLTALGLLRLILLRRSEPES